MIELHKDNGHILWIEPEAIVAIEVMPGAEGENDVSVIHFNNTATRVLEQPEEIMS